MNVGSRRPLARAVSTLRASGDAATTAAVSLSFWTAVCLPVALAALVVSGIDTRAEAGAFLALTAVEALALVGGRGYGS